MLGEPRIPSSYNRRGVAREETENNCNEKPLLLTQRCESYPAVPGESKKGFRHGGNLVRFIFQQVSVRPVWNGPECFQTTLAYTTCSLLCPHCASQSYTRDYLGQFFFQDGNFLLPARQSILETVSFHLNFTSFINLKALASC